MNTGKCNCGKVAKYMIKDGKEFIASCNEHHRCLTYNELSCNYNELLTKYHKLLRSSAGFSTSAIELSNYIDALPETDPIKIELSGITSGIFSATRNYLDEDDISKSTT